MLRARAGKVKAGGLPVPGRHLRAAPRRNGDLRFQVQHPLQRQYLVHQLVQPPVVVAVNRLVRQQAVLLQHLLRQGAVGLREQTVRRLADPAVIAGIFLDGVQDLPAQGQDHCMEGGLLPGDGAGHAVDLPAGVAAAVLVALQGVAVQIVSQDHQQLADLPPPLAIGHEIAVGGLPGPLVPAIALKAVGQHRGAGLIRCKGHRLGGGAVLVRGSRKVCKTVNCHRDVRRRLLRQGRLPVSAALQQGLIVRPAVGIFQIQSGGIFTSGTPEAPGIAADDQVRLRRLSVHRQAGGQRFQLIQPARNGIQRRQRHIRIRGVRQDIAVRHGRAPLGYFSILRIRPGREVPVRMPLCRDAGVLLRCGQRQHRPGVGHELNGIRRSGTLDAAAPRAAVAVRGPIAVKAPGDQPGKTRPAEHRQAGRHGAVPPPAGPFPSRGFGCFFH